MMLERTEAGFYLRKGSRNDIHYSDRTQMKSEARMPAFPHDGGDTHTASPDWSLSEFFYSFNNPRYQKELEEFRVEYESQFGDTDLTRRYTSILPTEQQEWLLENFPKRYWDGLPPFVQAYFKEKFRSAHQKGNLDDMPAKLLSLYLRNQMDIGNSGFSR